MAVDLMSCSGVYEHLAFQEAAAAGLRSLELLASSLSPRGVPAAQPDRRPGGRVLRQAPPAEAQAPRLRRRRPRRAPPPCRARRRAVPLLEEAEAEPAQAVSPHGACDRRRGSQSSSHAPASSDIPGDEYSWRKYGQKPIKGSPYPRGYYRCSSAKGCPARKHVERAADDPATLVVTYKGDHRHDAPAGAARVQ